MIKSKVYLDTTVPSAYFDNRTTDRQRLTREFWDECLPELEIFISDIVLAEITNTSDIQRRTEIESLVKNFQILIFNEEASKLADEYIKHGLFPEKSIDDATHVAIAVVNGIDYLASWNFKHLVKVKTKRGINLINILKGYNFIEIVTPPEL
ncbi:MAG: type II toxin-antitoxin system VapC family toxin [Candidatus Eremiobacterota bacterium]